MKKVIISLLTVLMVFTMVSCSQEIYTFKYETYDGTAITPVLLKDGETTTAKKTICDGYAFDGWYADPGYKVEYDFTKPVHKNTTVYAKWDQAFVTITAEKAFNFKGVGYWTDLQYSLDGYTWNGYDSFEEGDDPISVNKSVFEDDTYRLLLRGLDPYENGCVTGATDVNIGFSVYNDDGNVPFKCDGDIRTLIDYKKVKANEGVTVGEYAFANMFAGNLITEIPYLNSISTFTTGCFENMFYNCPTVGADKYANGSKVTFECTVPNPSKYCKNMFNGNPITETGTYYIHYGY